MASFNGRPRTVNDWYAATRDIILFLGGLAGVMHETIRSTSERPTLLLLFAAMMGLPAFLRSDEARKKFTIEEEQEKTSSKE